MTPDAQSIYVYAMQRVLSLATAHKDDDDAARLRAAMTEITAFINHAFNEIELLDAFDAMQRLPRKTA